MLFECFPEEELSLCWLELAWAGLEMWDRLAPRVTGDTLTCHETTSTWLFSETQYLTSHANSREILLLARLASVTTKRMVNRIQIGYKYQRIYCLHDLTENFNQWNQSWVLSLCVCVVLFYWERRLAEVSCSHLLSIWSLIMVNGQYSSIQLNTTNKYIFYISNHDQN